MSQHQPIDPNDSNSGLRSLTVGASVVIDGRPYDVMELRPTGDVLVQDVISREFRWCDYYACRLINPNENPSALLDALSTIAEKREDRVPE